MAPILPDLPSNSYLSLSSPPPFTTYQIFSHYLISPTFYSVHICHQPSFVISLLQYFVYFTSFLLLTITHSLHTSYKYYILTLPIFLNLGSTLVPCCHHFYLSFQLHTNYSSPLLCTVTCNVFFLQQGNFSNLFFHILTFYQFG